MQMQQERHTSTPTKRKVLGPCATVFSAASTGTWRQERPSVDAAGCVRCGTCARACPVDIVTIHKDGPVPVEMDWRYCKGCGICANECPKKCIRMISERGE